VTFQKEVEIDNNVETDVQKADSIARAMKILKNGESKDVDKA
jgi:hypothetical protein